MTNLMNSIYATSCVLYVLQKKHNVVDDPTLLVAQQYALAKKLPLAVVYCLQPKTDLSSSPLHVALHNGLNDTEEKLSKINIPLMVLVGERQKILSAVFYHTKPRAIYFDTNLHVEPQSLQQHFGIDVTCSIFVITKEDFKNATIIGNQHLQIHPYMWPGTVVSIQKLQEYLGSKLQP